MAGRKWYHWYSADDTPEERRFLLKLDLTLLPLALLSFWIKNMDYSNISMYRLGLKRSNPCADSPHTTHMSRV